MRRRLPEGDAALVSENLECGAWGLHAWQQRAKASQIINVRRRAQARVVTSMCVVGMTQARARLWCTVWICGGVHETMRVARRAEGCGGDWPAGRGCTLHCTRVHARGGPHKGRWGEGEDERGSGAIGRGFVSRDPEARALPLGAEKNGSEASEVSGAPGGSFESCHTGPESRWKTTNAPV